MMSFLRWLGIVVWVVALSVLAADEKPDPGLSRLYPETGEDLLGIHFTDASTGWIVGRKGALFLTADGGQTWIKPKAPFPKADFHAVFFTDPDHGWIVGDTSDGPAVTERPLPNKPKTAATILRTSNGGKKWDRAWAMTNYPLTDFCVIGKDRVLAVSHSGGDKPDGDLYTSVVAATRWAGDRMFRGMNAIRFFDERTGCMAGTRVVITVFPKPNNPRYQEPKSRILRTTDGGATWKPIVHPDLPGGGEILGLAVSGRTGWACGTKGILLRTEDAGATWTAQTSAVTAALQDVFAVDGKVAWAAGEGGTLLRTENGGETWVKVPTGETDQINRVWFTSANRGIMVGAKGLVLRYEKK
ncbi:MAG: YCF48-related protein [Planctomycetota bacterium]